MALRSITTPKLVERGVDKVKAFARKTGQITDYITERHRARKKAYGEIEQKKQEAAEWAKRGHFIKAAESIMDAIGILNEMNIRVNTGMIRFAKRADAEYRRSNLWLTATDFLAEEDKIRPDAEVDRARARLFILVENPDFASRYEAHARERGRYTKAEFSEICKLERELIEGAEEGRKMDIFDKMLCIIPIIVQSLPLTKEPDSKLITRKEFLERTAALILANLEGLSEAHKSEIRGRVALSSAAIRVSSAVCF